MSFALNGSANSHLIRTGSLGTSRDFQKLFAIKRTGAQVDNRYIMTMRGATAGHDVVTNNAGFGSTYAPVLLTNFTGAAGPVSVLGLNEWWWVAVGATGGIYTIRDCIHGAGSMTSATVNDSAKAAFALEQIHFGAAFGTGPFHCKFAYMFEASSEWSLPQILAQIASPTPILPVISFKSGLAGTLSAALLGDTGTTFTVGSGGVTLDTDAPIFGPTITGTIQLPEAQIVELSAPSINFITPAGGVAIISVGFIDPGAATLFLQRAPQIAGGPGSAGQVVTSYSITSPELLAGLKSVSIGGHQSASTYYYRAWVAGGGVQSFATQWVPVTFGTQVDLVGSEGPDVGHVEVGTSIQVDIECFEGGDFAIDSDGPIVTIFAPGTVTDEGAYTVSVSATDLTGVNTMSVTRNGTPVGSFTGPGPHSITENVGHNDNGTRNYVVTATDLGGNVTVTPPRAVVIAILEGAFSVTLTASSTSVTAPGVIDLTATVPEPVLISSVAITQNGVQTGQAITQSPYKKQMQYIGPGDNGTKQYQAIVTLDDDRVGYSNTVSVNVNIPSDVGQTLRISTGMADIMEIPRRDTSRAIRFQLTRQSDSLPMTGALPSVQIAKESSAYESPTGVVAEVSIAGEYVYIPSEADVNVEGRFSVSITAAGAIPVPVLHARIVTPYGKR